MTHQNCEPKGRLSGESGCFWHASCLLFGLARRCERLQCASPHQVDLRVALLWAWAGDDLWLIWRRRAPFYPARHFCFPRCICARVGQLLICRDGAGNVVIEERSRRCRDASKLTNSLACSLLHSQVAAFTAPVLMLAPSNVETGADAKRLAYERIEMVWTPKLIGTAVC